MKTIFGAVYTGRFLLFYFFLGRSFLWIMGLHEKGNGRNRFAGKEIYTVKGLKVPRGDSDDFTLFHLIYTFPTL